MSVATVLAQPPPRLAQRDAATYLELSPQQQHRLAALADAYRAGLDTRRVEAAALPSLQSPAARALCLRSTQAAEQARSAARDTLTPPQQQRLALLEQAHALMPTVESAQSVLLIDPTLTGTPLGLPQGTASLEFTFRRDMPALLPGCAAQQVLRPGVEPRQPDQ